jgi:hypothetical protein
MKTMMQKFVDAANAFDVDGIVALFAPQGLIEDSSVGETFRGHDGVRQYAEEYFVGYQTRSTVLSVDAIDERHMTARVDFTGNFGHETGFFEIATNEAGLITTVRTYLE